LRHAAGSEPDDDVELRSFIQPKKNAFIPLFSISRRAVGFD
jgi:hypothetical protein